MNNRYKVSKREVQHGCCFSAAVVDTTKPVMIGNKHYDNQYERVAECPELEDAERIVTALNEMENRK